MNRMIILLCVLFFGTPLSNAICPTGTFECDDGACVLRDNVCDDIENCPDGSDEKMCSGGCATNVTKFQCYGSGNCLSVSVECNGVKNCADGSDESECPDVTCSSGQRRCDNRVQCYNVNQLCDGRPNCHDLSDEKSCTACQAGLFKCRNNAECKLMGQLCDGRNDCGDGSDEVASVCATYMCPRFYFRCGSGECVRNTKQCNGANDCKDGSDEQYCPASMGCGRFGFYCQANDKCIHVGRLCDSVTDCSNNVDERNCPMPSLSTCVQNGNLLCNNGARCVPRNLVCDGRNDCGDARPGTDERNCRLTTTATTTSAGVTAPTCPSGQRRCPGSARCIPVGWFCDGTADCTGGTDERACSNSP